MSAIDASRPVQVASSEVRATAPRIKAFDFFCGAGGLTRGFMDAGIEVLCGVDVDERLRETYEHNNSPSKFECQDIDAIDIKRLRGKYGVTNHDITLYAACTPCQPFSTLNQRKGEDERKSLLLSFAEILKQSPPDFIVVENVPGLGNAYGREIYEEFLRTLESLGFEWNAEKIDAADQGVPQIRKRFLMIASRHGTIELPPTFRGKRRTVRTALEGLPAVGSKNSPPNHEFRKPKDNHLAILKLVPKDGGSRSDIADESVLLECHRKKPNVHKDVFGRMSWDHPSPTLTCRCTDVYCGRFAHPEEDRGLTIREAASIQTFGRRYKFFGTFFHIATQIGNAVPVKLAERLGNQVIKAAKDIE